MGFLDRLFRRRSSGAPLPTRDDTLSSTYVPPPTPETGIPDDSKDADAKDDEKAQDDQVDSSGGGDGGDGGGGGGGN
jgi:hypothetical protein